MRSYLFYFLLLLIIFISMVDTWGEGNKTIMYGIAVISIVSLKIKNKDFKHTDFRKIIEISTILEQAIDKMKTSSQGATCLSWRRQCNCAEYYSWSFQYC